MGGGLSKHQDEVTSSSTMVAALEPSVTTTTSSSSSPSNPSSTDSQEESSKCPMHRQDGSYSYSYDWKQLFRAAAVHGPKGSKPLSKEQQEQAKQPTSSTTGGGGGGGCPVKHDHNNNNPPPTPTGGGCPVKGGDKSYPEYNVYSQPIDKTNQMPKGVKTQLPVATQKSELSTNRVSSTIPKGGGEADANNNNTSTTTTWTYPSPQQFYNALSRKGKLGDDDTSEEDMESVVALHNNMNEKTWAQVVEWEKQTYSGSSDNTLPKLLKFQGRPHDLSPKAGLKHYLLGHPLPYDRHDWTVLRDDGTTVRYVIDYYYDESQAQETSDSAQPKLHDRQATPSLLVDVRPALDGPSQLLARAVQMPYKVATTQTTFAPLPLKGTPEMANQVQESINVWQNIQALRNKELLQEEASSMAATKISPAQAKEIAESFAKILKDCRVQQQGVQNCDSEGDCAKASMDLTMCMGPILCPIQHKGLMKALNEQSDSDDKIGAALETLSECVVLQTAHRQLAKQQHPVAFQK